MSKRILTLESLLNAGFDASKRKSGGFVRIACSHCNAGINNKVPIHQVGCTNTKYECVECGLGRTRSTSITCADCLNSEGQEAEEDEEDV